MFLNVSGVPGWYPVVGRHRSSQQPVREVFFFLEEEAGYRGLRKLGGGNGLQFA